jgi:hypothetical protein
VILIKLYVTYETFTEVQIGKTSSTNLTHLKDLHEISNKYRAFVLKNMFLMMMDEHASLQKHSLKIKETREWLMAIDRNMEVDMVVIILKSLPSAYKHFIDTLNITSMNVDLKFDELYNKLLQ